MKRPGKEVLDPPQVYPPPAAPTSEHSLKSRVAFVLISKLYRQMYANTGIATDSARMQRSTRWARWFGLACRRLFLAKPMPELEVPGEPFEPAIGPAIN